MEELGTIAEDRSRIYWLLAGFFMAAPEPALLEQMSSVSTGETTNDGELGRHLTQLRRSLAERAPREELQGDYARLFLGLREGYGLPPPYESLHREGRLFGQSTAAVVEHFRRSGISLAQESVGPEDHLGSELKFLSLLCLRESQAWRNADTAEARTCLEAERAFLDQHLVAWVPDYCRQVADGAQTDYYRSVAGLTAAAIGNDALQVAEILDSLAGNGAQDARQGGLQ